MKRFSLLSIVMAVACICTAAENIPATLKALHPANEKIECGFTEVRVKAKVNKSETHTGSLVYQAPDDLRMDYTDPAGDYILITADKMEQCKNGKTQSVKTKGKDNRYATYRATLLSCIAGDIEKAASLNNATTECKKEGSKYVCTITAKEASGKDIKEIKLEYDVTSGRVLTITLTEGNGNYATYTTHP